MKELQDVTEVIPDFKESDFKHSVFATIWKTDRSEFVSFCIRNPDNTFAFRGMSVPIHSELYATYYNPLTWSDSCNQGCHSIIQLMRSWINDFRRRSDNNSHWSYKFIVLENIQDLENLSKQYNLLQNFKESILHDTNCNLRPSRSPTTN